MIEEFKIGDKVFWKKDVILIQDDWTGPNGPGGLSDYEDKLREVLRGNDNHLIISSVHRNYVQIGKWCYPKKLFTKNFTNIYELW